MTQQELPKDLQEFIYEHISSVLELELLLLLQSSAPRQWSAPEAAAELRSDPIWAGAQLTHLARRGLLRSTASDPVRFSFGPEKPEIRRVVDALAAAYADRRVTIISLIYSKPPDPLRHFADAFRIRKDKTDG